jgi:hypothetical protein
MKLALYKSSVRVEQTIRRTNQINLTYQQSNQLYSKSWIITMPFAYLFSFAHLKPISLLQINIINVLPHPKLQYNVYVDFI